MFTKTIQFPTLRNDVENNVQWINGKAKDIFSELPTNWLSFRSSHGQDFVTNTQIESALIYAFDCVCLNTLSEDAYDGNQYIEVNISNFDATFNVFTKKESFDGDMKWNDLMFSLSITNDGHFLIMLGYGSEAMLHKTNDGTSELLNEAVTGLIKSIERYRDYV